MPRAAAEPVPVPVSSLIWLKSSAAGAKRDLLLRGVGVLGALLAALYIYSVIQSFGATLASH